jgi:hypothetical protein
MAILPLALTAQDVNDDCASAIEIFIDISVPFSTINATNAGPIVTGCGSFTPAENDSIPADIWFFFTSTENATYSWSNCGSGFDSRMAVYTGTDACAVTNDDLLQCNDDGAGCALSESILAFTVTTGTTYVLRLGGFANADTPVTTGAGTVTLTKLNVPANDACINATPLSLGTGQPFTTTNATTDGPDHDGASPCFQFGQLSINRDIWYTFTPDFTGTVQWTNCEDSNFDSRMGVYQPGSACPPLPEDLLGCNDDGPDCPTNTFRSDMFFDVTAGETYLLRFGGYDDGEQGIGTFDLINNSPPEPPANDDCANAIETFILTPAEADDFADAQGGTTIGATSADENFVDPPCLEAEGFNPGGLWGDVWYTVQTQGNDSIQMRIFSDGQEAGTDFFMDAFANCTDTLAAPIAGTCFRIDDDANLGRRSTITGLPSGENITIYVRVSSRLTTQMPGSFGFQLVGAISTSTRAELRVEDLKLYPNPVSEQLTVSMVLPEGTNLEAQLFDLLGRNVLSRNLGNLPGGPQQFDFNTSDLAAGVYSLRITDGHASKAIKFVKN